MHVDLLRIALRPVFAPAVLIRPDEFLLLGVHADHRLTSSQRGLDLLIDVVKLGVAVSVPAALQGLGIGLQAEPLLRQQPPHCVIRDRMTLGGQLTSQRVQRLGRPPQRRFRVTTRHWLHQRVQRRRQPRIHLLRTPAARARPAHPPPGRRIPGQLLDPIGDRVLGHLRDRSYELGTAIAQRTGLSREPHPARPLIQMITQVKPPARQAALQPLTLISGHGPELHHTSRSSTTTRRPNFQIIH